MISEKLFKFNQFKRMLERDVKGQMLTPSHWKVPSMTSPGVTYDRFVEERGGLLYAECGCKAGKNEKACAHGLWVLRQVYFDPRILFAVVKGLEVAA